jgi:hypothetical protein
LAVVINCDDAHNRSPEPVPGEQHHAPPHAERMTSVRERRPTQSLVVLGVQVGFASQLNQTAVLQELRGHEMVVPRIGHDRALADRDVEGLHDDSSSGSDRPFNGPRPAARLQLLHERAMLVAGEPRSGMSGPTTPCVKLVGSLLVTVID